MIYIYIYSEKRAVFENEQDVLHLYNKAGNYLPNQTTSLVTFRALLPRRTFNYPESLDVKNLLPKIYHHVSFLCPAVLGVRHKINGKYKYHKCWKSVNLQAQNSFFHDQFQYNISTFVTNSHQAEFDSLFGQLTSCYCAGLSKLTLVVFKLFYLSSYFIVVQLNINTSKLKPTNHIKYLISKVTIRDEYRATLCAINRYG